MIDIRVEHSGRIATLPQAFNFIHPLTVDAIFEADPKPGRSVRVFASWFDSGFSVTIEGVTIPISPDDGSAGRFVMPSVSPCTQTMQFTNANGATDTHVFNVIASISGGSNLTGTVQRGGTFYLTGTNMTSGTRIFVGGVEAQVTFTPSTWTTPSLLTVTAPPSTAPGLAPITVASYLGCPAATNLFFSYK